MGDEVWKDCSRQITEKCNDSSDFLTAQFCARQSALDKGSALALFLTQALRLPFTQVITVLVII
ncbi:hypothetical protein M5K25_006604 [Dendrobium thyrsiflorum]|uniref:Uncharacterized protein n=1 Tax=Dendrobium thyrsiflorum TaxID=117978 RepID=A0ABD0VD95_DENTH